MKLDSSFRSPHSGGHLKSSDLGRPSSSFQLLRFYGMLLASLLLSFYSLAAGAVIQVPLSQQAAHLTGSPQAVQGAIARRMLSKDVQHAIIQQLSDQGRTDLMDNILLGCQHDMANLPRPKFHSSYAEIEVDENENPARNLNSASSSAADGTEVRNEESIKNSASSYRLPGISNSYYGDRDASDSSSAIHDCDGQGCGHATSVTASTAAGDKANSNLGSSIVGNDKSDHAGNGNSGNGNAGNEPAGNGNFANTTSTGTSGGDIGVHPPESSNGPPPQQRPGTLSTPNIGTPQSPPQPSNHGESQEQGQQETTDLGHCPNGTRISPLADPNTGECGANRVLLQVSLVKAAEDGRMAMATAADGKEAAEVVGSDVVEPSTKLMCAYGPTFSPDTSSLTLSLCWRPTDLPEGALRNAAAATAAAAADDGSHLYDSNVSTGLMMTLPRLTWYGISSMAPGDYSLTMYGTETFGAVVHAAANGNVSGAAAAALPPAAPVMSPSSIASSPPSPPHGGAASDGMRPPAAVPPVSANSSHSNDLDQVTAEAAVAVAVARTISVPAGGISTLTLWFSVAPVALGSSSKSSAGGNGNGNASGNGNGNGNGNSGNSNGSSDGGNGGTNGNGSCRFVTITLVRQLLPSESMMSPLPLPPVQAPPSLTSKISPPYTPPVLPPLTSMPPPYTLPTPPYPLTSTPPPAVSPSHRCKCPHTVPSPTSCPSGLTPLVPTRSPTAATATLLNGVHVTSAVQCVPPPMYERVTRRLTFSTCWRYSCLSGVVVRQPYELLIGPVSLTESTSPPAGTYRIRTWVPPFAVLSYESLGAATSSTWQAVTMPAATSGNETVGMNNEVRTTVPYGGLRQIRIRIQVPADPALDDMAISLEVALLRLDPRAPSVSSNDTRTSEAVVTTAGKLDSSDTTTSSSSSSSSGIASSGMVLETPDGSGVAVPPPLPAIVLTNANATLKVVSELWVTRRISSGDGGEGNGISASSGGGASSDENSQQNSSVFELVDLLRRGMVNTSSNWSSPANDTQQTATTNTSSSSTTFEDAVELQGFRLTLPLAIQSVPSSSPSTTTSYPPSYQTTSQGLTADCSAASLTALRATAATALAALGDSLYSTATLASVGCLYESYDSNMSGRRRALLQAPACTAVVTVHLVVDVPPVDLGPYLTAVTSFLASVYGDSACPLDPASPNIGIISKLAISISLPAAKVLSSTSSLSEASGINGSAMAACTTGSDLLVTSLGLGEGEAHLVGCQLSAEVPVQEVAPSTDPTASLTSTTDTTGPLSMPASGSDPGTYGSQGSTKHGTSRVILAVAVAAAAGGVLLALAVAAFVRRWRRSIKLLYKKDSEASSSASTSGLENGSAGPYDGGSGGSKDATLVMAASSSRRLPLSSRGGDGYDNGRSASECKKEVDAAGGDGESVRQAAVEYGNLQPDGGDDDHRRGGGDRDSCFLAVVPTSLIPTAENQDLPVWYDNAVSQHPHDLQIRRTSRPTLSPYSEGAVSIGWYDYFGLDDIECDAECDKVQSRPSTYGGDECGNGGEDRGTNVSGGGGNEARRIFALRRSNAGILAWRECSDLSEEEIPDISVCPNSPSRALAATPRASPEGNGWGPLAGPAVAAATAAAASPTPSPMLSTARALRLSFALPGADPALYGCENLENSLHAVQFDGVVDDGGGGLDEGDAGALLRVESRRPAFLDRTGGSLAAAVAATMALPRRAVRRLYGAVTGEAIRRGAVAADGGGGGNGGGRSDSKTSAGRGFTRRNSIVPYTGGVSMSYSSYTRDRRCGGVTAPQASFPSAVDNDRPTGFEAWSAPLSMVRNDDTYDTPDDTVEESPFILAESMYDALADRSAWNGFVFDNSPRRTTGGRSLLKATASEGSGLRPRQESKLSGSVSDVLPPCSSLSRHLHHSALTGGCATADAADCRTLRQPPRLQSSCTRLSAPDVDAGGKAPPGDGADAAAAVLTGAADDVTEGPAVLSASSYSAVAAASADTDQTRRQVRPDAAAPCRLPPLVIPLLSRKTTLPPMQPNTPQTHDVQSTSSSPSLSSSPPPPPSSTPSGTAVGIPIPPPAPSAAAALPSAPPPPIRTSPRLDDLLPVAALDHEALVLPPTHKLRRPPRSPRLCLLRPSHPNLYTRSSSLASSTLASFSALPLTGDNLPASAAASSSLNPAAASAVPFSAAAVSDDGSGFLDGLVDSDVEACASGGAVRLAQLRQLALGPPRPAWGLVHAGALPFRRSIASLSQIQNLNND